MPIAQASRRSMVWISKFFSLCLALVLANLAQADPTKRIISLTPHLTEMLFAIGAGGQIVGVVNRTDYPPEANTLPSVGDYNLPDVEKILALKPDLILAWQGGVPAQVVERLRQLGLRVEWTQGERLSDVPRTLRQLGAWSGHTAEGEEQASRFEQALASEAARHAGKRMVSGLYEIWPQPLMTVSDRHFIAEAMRICGIRNIAGEHLTLTPNLNEEEVLRARPELLLASPPARDFQRWRRFADLPAVRHNLLIVLPADVLVRPGPRLIEGVHALCAAAEQARKVMP